ncbi:MAG: hypothetical protein L0H93_06630 [Nocardioides sp.]|nr:hypothetical protein [Nocardioides sp.]
MTPFPRTSLLISALVAPLLTIPLLGAAPATAATGTLTDPRGDLPDIVRLSWTNAPRQVTIKMTFAGAFAQVDSFYMRWGKARSYQVFYAPATKHKELRLDGRTVRCPKLKVAHHRATHVSTATVPRACIPKAPNKLRFQGVATYGLFNSDQTRTSAPVRKG